MKKIFTFPVVWVAILAVVITGLFFPPLMGNDAPEYATIALRMHRDHDYVNIINRDYDYLDKPHILFWSAAAGFQLFGVHDWSYRIISTIICLLGAYATFRLGKLLYSSTVGHLAAILYATSQAILLGMHDVRTDALLTGFIIFAVWQFVEFIARKKLMHSILGGTFLALAVGTKGMIAVLVVGCCVFFYVLSTRQWKSLFHWKLLFSGIAFCVVLSPVLYCYYLQFDLHPEKYVNGAYNVSAIKFLLWTQSFDRLAATRGSVNPEFTFLFHNFLWSFLPWTLLALFAWADRFRDFIRMGFKALFAKEQLTFLGTFMMFIIMSLSKFKLPHYINVLFPMIAIGTAAFLIHQFTHSHVAWKKAFKIAQYITLSIVLILSIVLHTWVFPIQNYWILLPTILFIVWIFYCFRALPESTHVKFWLPSALAILAFNFLLNTNFYTQLGHYQAGSTLAKQLAHYKIDAEDTFTYNYIFRSFDFYSKWISPQLSQEQLHQKANQGHTFFVVVSEKGKQDLFQSGLVFKEVMKTPHVHITRLKADFLNPATRDKNLSYAYLIQVN